MLAIRTVPFDHPTSQALIAELDAELEARYAHDDGEGEPDFAMLNVLGAAVSPPLGTFLVAHLGDDAVGCGALRPAPTGEEGVAEIKRMYVAPPARGRGISRSLLAGLEQAATDLGYRRVILETGTRQQEAMALYASAGYAVIANYGAYRHSRLSRCFGKALAAPGQPWPARAAR